MLKPVELSEIVIPQILTPAGQQKIFELIFMEIQKAGKASLNYYTFQKAIRNSGLSFIKAGDKGPRLTVLLSKFSKDYLGHVLSKDALEEIGNIAARYTPKMPRVIYDIVEGMKWGAGDFGDAGSCFFQPGGEGDNRKWFQLSGGLAVRIYDDKKKGIGRILTWSIEDMSVEDLNGKGSKLSGGTLGINSYGMPLANMGLVLNSICDHHSGIENNMYFVSPHLSVGKGSKFYVNQKENGEGVRGNNGVIVVPTALPAMPQVLDVAHLPSVHMALSLPICRGCGTDVKVGQHYCTACAPKCWFCGEVLTVNALQHKCDKPFWADPGSAILQLIGEGDVKNVHLSGSYSVETHVQDSPAAKGDFAGFTLKKGHCSTTHLDKDLREKQEFLGYRLSTAGTVFGCIETPRGPSIEAGLILLTAHGVTMDQICATVRLYTPGEEFVYRSKRYHFNPKVAKPTLGWKRYHDVILGVNPKIHLFYPLVHKAISDWVARDMMAAAVTLGIVIEGGSAHKEKDAVIYRSVNVMEG